MKPPKYELLRALAMPTLLVILLLVAACSNTLNQSNSKIKIGVIAPFTGDFSSYGDDLRRGVELAAQDLNAQGGINGKEIDLIFEDACLPPDALAAAKKLVHMDRVEYIGSTFCIIGVTPIATVTEPENMSVIVVAAVPDNVIDAGEHIFSANIASRTEAKVQAEYAYNVLGARTASIVYINTELGISYNENFIKYFEELGGKVLTSEKLEIVGNDFRTALTKVKNANPDVVLSIHLGNQGGIVLKQMGALNMDRQVLSYYQGENPVVLEVAGENAEGFIISTPTQLELSDNQIRFREMFEQRYGAPASVIAMSAYDGFMMQAKAYERCDGDRECIQLTLYDTKGYDGVSGRFDIGSDGTAIKDFIFKQVKNGEFEVIESFA